MTGCDLTAGIDSDLDTDVTAHGVNSFGPLGQAKSVSDNGVSSIFPRPSMSTAR